MIQRHLPKKKKCKNRERKEIKDFKFQPWQHGLMYEAFLISDAADMLLNLRMHYQNFHMQHLQIALKLPVEAMKDVTYLQHAISRY